MLWQHDPYCDEILYIVFTCNEAFVASTASIAWAAFVACHKTSALGCILPAGHLVRP